MSAFILVFVPAVVLAQGKPAPECTADAECLISIDQGCCGSCCAPEPYATSVTARKSMQARCAVVDCAAPNCAAVRCKQPQPASAFKAVCQSGRCVAVRTSEKQRPAECRTDAECTIIYPAPDVEDETCRGSPCGCCPPTTPMAVSIDDPRARPPTPSPGTRPRPLTKKDTAKEEPKYGLTPGNSARRTPEPPLSPPVTPPNCSPCPSPKRVRAECLEGRCSIAPHALE